MESQLYNYYSEVAHPVNCLCIYCSAVRLSPSVFEIFSVDLMFRYLIVSVVPMLAAQLTCESWDSLAGLDVQLGSDVRSLQVQRAKTFFLDKKTTNQLTSKTSVHVRVQMQMSMRVCAWVLVYACL